MAYNYEELKSIIKDMDSELITPIFDYEPETGIYSIQILDNNHQGFEISLYGCYGNSDTYEITPVGG